MPKSKFLVLSSWFVVRRALTTNYQLITHNLPAGRLGQKGAAHFALLAVAVVGILAFIWVSSTTPFQNKLFTTLFPKPSSHASNENPRAKLANLTNMMLAQARAYGQSKNAEALANLKNTIEQRKQALVEAAKSDPNLVLEVALDGKTRRNMPEAVQELLEQEATIEGTMNGGHGDDLKNHRVEYAFMISTEDNQMYNVYGTDQTNFVPLSKVIAKGILVDHTLVLPKGSENLQIVSLDDVQGVSTVVTYKPAIIMFNFQNDTSQPFQADFPRGVVFTNPDSVRAYYLENSYGHNSITGKYRPDGDVFGWYTIPYNNTMPGGDLTTCITSTLVPWGNNAKNQAIAQGYDLSGYNSFMYAVPLSNLCGYAGIAWNGSTYMASPTYFDTSVVGHEIGHTLGPNHANTYTCTQNGSPSAISDKSQCYSTEYGDPFDVMGTGRNQMHSYHKVILGAFAGSNMQTVTTSGTYTIAPLEPNSSAVQMIKIPRAKSGTTIYDNYYLDYRQAIGLFDANLVPPETTGVSIHIECNSPYVNCPLNIYSSATTNKSLLIDNSPGDGNFYNSALQVGQTFTDSAYGISVTTLSVNSSGATVQINVAGTPCVRANPTVSVSPTSQWTTSGTSLNYTVSVRNNDNSGCSTSTFNITSSLAAGLSQSPSSTSLSIAPGATANATISVTSTAGLGDGAYSFTEIATNTSATSFAGSGVANYNISAPLPTPTPTPLPTPTSSPTTDFTNPTVSIASPLNLSTISRNTNFTISATASDNIAVSKVEFYVNNSLKCTDTSSPYSCTVKIGGKPNSNHSLQAKAYDTSNNTSSASVVVRVQ
jgi:hypothetical protein